MTRLQRRGPTIQGMHPDIDAAIETATERTREAQEDLTERLAETPQIELEARVVEHRAEDLQELAVDAASADDASNPDAI